MTNQHSEDQAINDQELQATSGGASFTFKNIELGKGSEIDGKTVEQTTTLNDVVINSKSPN